MCSILDKYFVLKIWQWSYTSLQIIRKISMSFSHLLVRTILLFIYVVQTITRKWDITFMSYMSSLDYLFYFGYLLGTRGKKNFLPADKTLYPYSYLRVKFCTHTHTRRVGYPRVKLTSLCASRGPNLSKDLCSFHHQFQISTKPYLQTYHLGVSLGQLGG